MAKGDKKETYQNVRLPLVGSYFHRTDDTELYLTDGKDQQFVNCYFSKVTNPLTGTETFKVKKRPGWVDSSLTFSGVTSNGIFSAKFWDVTNDNTSPLSIWNTGTNEAQVFLATTSIGTVAIGNADEASDITSAKNGSTQSFLFWVGGLGGTNREAYYSDGATITEITDADFPDATMRGNFVFMDGYAFIITEAGDIWNSDLNSLSAWTSTSFINSGAKPDEGVTLARYKDKIVAFNTTSIEFFELNPNPPAVGSVLQRVNHLAILDIGCYRSQSHVARVDVKEYSDTVFWISGGVGPVGQPSQTAIYMLNNYQPVKISTPEVEAIISLDYRLAGVITFQGYNYVVLYNKTDSEFILFDIGTKAWFRWKLGFTTGAFCPILQGNTFGNGAISMFRGTERYEIYVDTDPSSYVYQDDGNTYTMKIQTSRIDFGTNKRKRLHKLDVIGDKQGTANNLSINWSDNDYTSFTTARTVAMGDDRPYLNNCGIFRRRAFKLEHSANTACELEAIELQLSMMET